MQLSFPPFGDVPGNTVDQGGKRSEQPLVCLRGSLDQVQRPLFVDEPGFSGLRERCDFSIALSADEALLKDRLIGRKLMGGSSREKAEEHYAFCDQPNILRFLQNSAPGDVNLRVIDDGAYGQV